MSFVELVCRLTLAIAVNRWKLETEEAARNRKTCAKR